MFKIESLKIVGGGGPFETGDFRKLVVGPIKG